MELFLSTFSWEIKNTKMRENWRMPDASEKEWSFSALFSLEIKLENKN